MYGQTIEPCMNIDQDIENVSHKIIQEFGNLPSLDCKIVKNVTKIISEGLHQIYNKGYDNGQRDNWIAQREWEQPMA